MIRTLIANIPHSGMYDFENAHVKSIYHCHILAKKLGFGLPKCSLGARSKADDLANLIWAARLQNFHTVTASCKEEEIGIASGYKRNDETRMILLNIIS